MTPRCRLRAIASISAAALAALTACTGPAEDEVGDDASEVRSTGGDPIALLSATPDVWRTRIAARAAEWKAIEPRTRSGRLATPSPSDPTLGIEWVFVPAKSKATNLVLMNSGIHGVEAPAGVLFQDMLLGECGQGTTIDRSETAILVVMAMNPFGAKEGRRFNFANVDLNRNFFDAQTNRGESFRGRAIINQDYRDTRHLLEGGRISIVDIAAAFVKHGSDALNRALSGQYEFPEGIYFGGHEVQPESAAVQGLVQELIGPFANVAVIDMHTGLGKEGINQVMTNALPPSSPAEVAKAHTREMELLATMFPASECAGVCEVQGLTTSGGGEEISDAFTTTGDFTQWFHEKFADKRTRGTVLSVTSEIGTITARKVLEGLVDENFCFWHRDDRSCGAEQYEKDVSHLRALFNPPDPAWQANVVRASRQMCSAIGRFAKLR